MARMKKESLEAKIKKAEYRVVRTGKNYNAACEELQSLRDKMAALESEELIAAFIKSNKTLEEAIAFFESDVKPDEVPVVTKKRGGRRKRKTT